MKRTTQPITPPAWANVLGGPAQRGPNPAVALAVLWALDDAGTYGATAREIANATNLCPRNVIGCLANLRSRWGVCFSRSDATGRWARHFGSFVSTKAADEALAHWLADLAEKRKAAYAASTKASRERIKAIKAADAERRAELRAKADAEMKAARERKAEERRAADRLRLAKANEAAANNVLAKRIKGTRSVSQAPEPQKPATITMPADVKVTRCPAPRGRFELLQPAEGGLRSLPIGKYLEPPRPWLVAAGVAK